MSENDRRRNTFIILALLLLLVLLLLLRCRGSEPSAPAPLVPNPAPAATTQTPPPPVDVATPAEPAEVLSAATLDLPPQVAAGARFAVAWIGPDNRGDFVTVVSPGAPPESYGSYRETKEGPILELTAPIEPGLHEVRYVAVRSHTVLGRAVLEVLAAEVSLDAAPEVVLGGELSVSWSGPDNEGDYITLVPEDMPDGQYANYTETKKGSPLSVRAPSESGPAELRYMSGQGQQVLARREVSIVQPSVTLAAPDEVVAGAKFQVDWSGPDNPGDYVTLVESGTPDGEYGNYEDTRVGSPLALLAPILEGEAELRYMTGQGRKVLARRKIRVVAAKITLDAVEEAAPGSQVKITWTGPDNSGDYLTIVESHAADGKFGSYTNTSSGSPLEVRAPKDPGEAEIRYMTGQGGKVLARRPIRITP